MREAIGTTWILMIVVAFITLFSGYLAFSVNYSKAFRLKDSIVQSLEKYSGPNDNSIGEIEAVIDEIGYSSLGSCNGAPVGDANQYVTGVREGVIDTDPKPGERFSYCISKVTSLNGEAGILGAGSCSPGDKNCLQGQMTAAYYKVAVFFSISIPIAGMDSLFFINGETINVNYPLEKYKGTQFFNK